jgi:hypothetical protein
MESWYAGARNPTPRGLLGDVDVTAETYDNRDIFRIGDRRGVIVAVRRLNEVIIRSTAEIGHDRHLVCHEKLLAFYSKEKHPQS